MRPAADDLDASKGESRLSTIFEGTSEIQRRFISDEMLPAC